MACLADDLAIYAWHALILMRIYIEEYVSMSQCPYALASAVYALVCISIRSILEMI